LWVHANVASIAALKCALCIAMGKETCVVPAFRALWAGAPHLDSKPLQIWMWSCVFFVTGFALFAKPFVFNEESSLRASQCDARCVGNCVTREAAC
jgi:hypothetical protein